MGLGERGEQAVGVRVLLPTHTHTKNSVLAYCQEEGQVTEAGTGKQSEEPNQDGRTGNRWLFRLAFLLLRRVRLTR